MDFQNNFQQFLQDSEDENTNKKEMMELETAIKISKQTITADEEQRLFQRQSEEIETLFNSDDADSPQNKSTKQNSAGSDKKEESGFTFQDMPKTKFKSLEIIHHSPVYDLPIPTNPRYKGKSVEYRVKLLDNYFRKVGELRARMARRSIHRAPFSKPILPSNKYKESLKDSDQDQYEASSVFDSSQEMYVSRSGRQVKRKIYTEEMDMDSDSDFEPKKNRLVNTEDKITLETPLAAEPEAVRFRKESPRPRQRPPLSLSRKGRTEKLLANSAEESERARQRERKKEEFERTLAVLVEADEEEEKEYVRKVVPPPMPAKKQGRTKKPTSQEDFDNIEIIPATPPDSPILKQSSVNRTLEKRSQKNQKSKENVPENSSKLMKTACPICGKQFLQSEIEDHAATCENFENKADELEKNDSSVYITCSLCDKVFYMNTDYEVHVKQCVAAQVTDM